MRTNFNLSYKTLLLNLNKLGNKITDKSSALKWNRENKIKKYVNLHDYYNGSEAMVQINNMREPIAAFAKKNNLKIDIYEKTSENNKQFIHAVIEDTKKTSDGTNKFIIDIDSDTSKIYPKEAISDYLAQIEGEETQVMRKVKSFTEDNFLRNFFRELETARNTIRVNSK